MICYLMVILTNVSFLCKAQLDMSVLLEKKCQGVDLICSYFVSDKMHCF